jgi:hypothetical protein
MKAYKKKISKKRFYREYVSILNGVLQLSHREADVFAALLQINAEWGTMVKQIGNVLSTDARRQLMKETRITKTNLARYIIVLVEKGILMQLEGDKYMLNELFVPVFIGNVCDVTFTLEVVD